jgi:hypothetical protein
MWPVICSVWPKAWATAGTAGKPAKAFRALALPASLTKKMSMDTQEQIWVEAFAHRLLTECPRVGAPDAEHIGESLWRDRPWQGLPPDAAASQWLVQVGLVASTGDSRRAKAPLP